MGHWNYRVIKTKDGEDDYYQVHSCYYTDNKLDGTSVEPAKAAGNTLEELRADLQRMLDALDKPIIDETNLKQ